MANRDNIGSSSLSKWTITLALLFSLFAFSGNISENRIYQKPSHQKERVLTHTGGKRTFSFASLPHDFRPITVYTISWTDRVNASLSQYERFVRTKFDWNSKRFDSIQKSIKINIIRYASRDPEQLPSGISRG